MFWPNLDQWPPSKQVVMAAAVLAFVVMPLAMLTGIVGYVIYGAIIIIAVALSLRAQLKRANQRAEEFWRSGPDD